jgi:hypothetical protein
MEKKYLFYLLLCLVLFSGCEKNPYFQSESKVSKKIQGRWQLIRVNPSETPQDWIFQNGQVYIIGTSKTPNDTLDIGTYSITTTISDAFVVVNNFHVAVYLNTKFTISNLNDNVLALVGPDGVSNAGTVNREFVAKK